VFDRSAGTRSRLMIYLLLILPVGGSKQTDQKKE
jgi:hypothetical protein